MARGGALDDRLDDVSVVGYRKDDTCVGEAREEGAVEMEFDSDGAFEWYWCGLICVARTW